jgi:hypothetical protein
VPLSHRTPPGRTKFDLGIVDDALTRERLSCVPESLRGGTYRALTRPVAPRQAIKIQCLECCGWDRKAAQSCEALCPLRLVARQVWEQRRRK